MHILFVRPEVVPVTGHGDVLPLLGAEKKTIRMWNTSGLWEASARQKGLNGAEFKWGCG